MAASARIAVVGDVHDDWDIEEDTKALQALQPDLVLFTGDFGNENAELVQNVAKLKFPKAAILGNHDSWKTQKFSKKKKDGVQLQLERYGVQNMDESATKIYNAALGCPEEHFIIFLAHNRPTALGSNVNDICGKDWVAGSSGGDHGDPDLEQAICRLKETTNITIPLVVFGHMHKELAHGNGLRKMIVVGADKTIYLNAAIVPRVQRFNFGQRVPDRSFANKPESSGTMRAFTVIEILEGRVCKIAETWVSVVGDDAIMQEEQILFDCDHNFVNR